MGKPIKGVKIKIKKNKSKSGFIVIYGKNVCLGYSDKYEDLNKANENNFKFISSDIGRLDEDNFLYILKRSNRISKIFGLRIDLSDIEKTLKKNNIEVVCSSDDQFIKIKTSKKNRFDKILDIIKKNYGINKNYIKLTKQKNKYRKQILYLKMEKTFAQKIKDLTILHFKNCKEYKKILKTINYNLKNENLETQPFLPVNLFKEKNLKSIPNNKVVKILESSGTSGSSRSKIFLDQLNALSQKKVLLDLVKKILPDKRIPMLIIDQNPIFADKKKIEARLAGIYGFSIFGSDHTYF